LLVEKHDDIGKGIVSGRIDEQFFELTVVYSREETRDNVVERELGF
jgi:hypothetical protein